MKHEVRKGAATLQGKKKSHEAPPHIRLMIIWLMLRREKRKNLYSHFVCRESNLFRWRFERVWRLASCGFTDETAALKKEAPIGWLAALRHVVRNKLSTKRLVVLLHYAIANNLVIKSTTIYTIKEFIELNPFKAKVSQLNSLLR